MNHSVLLVQRGISEGTHAVSGKSGKLYGTAVQTPGFGGVVLKMPLDVYSAAADDLIGSTVPMQQWVPHFISEGISLNGTSRAFTGEERGLCSIPAGCRLGPGGSAAEADYMWQHYRFCAGHAPSNAKAIWAGAPPIYDGSRLHPTGTSDVHQVLVDRGVSAGLTEKDGPTPPEVMAPIVVGGLHENAPTPIPAPVVGAAEMPVPLPVYGGPRRANFADPILGQPPAPVDAAPIPAPVVQPIPPTPVAEAPPPAPRGPSAAEVIQQSVAAAVAAAVPTIVQELKGHVAGMVANLAPPPTPPKKARAKTAKAPDAAPTMFELSRQRAHELGMNTFGKGKAEMDKWIADHENQSGAGAPAPTDEHLMVT